MRALVLGSLVASAGALTRDCGKYDPYTNQASGDPCLDTQPTQPVGGMKCSADWQCGPLTDEAGTQRSVSRPAEGSCLFLDGSYPEPSSPVVDGFPVDKHGNPARCHCTDGYGCQNCALKMDQEILPWYKRWQEPTATSDKNFGLLFKQPPSNFSTWAARTCATPWPAESTAASFKHCQAGNGNCTEGCTANDPRPGGISRFFKPFDKCEASGGPGWSLNDFKYWATNGRAGADLPDGKDIVYPLSTRTNMKTSGFSAANLAVGQPAPCTVGKCKNAVCEGDVSCGEHASLGVSGLCIPLAKDSTGAGQCACTVGYTGSRCQIQSNDLFTGSQEGDYTAGGSACEVDTDCGVEPKQKPNEKPGLCIAQPVFGQKVCECRKVYNGALGKYVDYVCGSCRHKKAEVLSAAFGGTESCPCSTPSLMTAPGTYCARPSKSCDDAAAPGSPGKSCFLIDVYGGGAKCKSLWATDNPGTAGQEGNMAMCPVPDGTGVCKAAKPCASKSVSGRTVIALAGAFVGKDTAKKTTVYSVACPTNGATPPKINTPSDASPFSSGEYYVADAFAANFLDSNWGLEIYPTDELTNKVNLTQTNTDGKYDKNTKKDHQWEPTRAYAYDAVMPHTAFHVDIHVRAPPGCGHSTNSTNVCGWGTGQNIIITGPDGTRHDVRSVGGKKCDAEFPLHEGDWILPKQALSRGENIFKVEVVPLGENCQNATPPVKGCPQQPGHYQIQNYTIHVQLPAKPFPWLYLSPVALMVLIGFIYGLFNCYIKYLRCWYKEKNHDPFLVRLLGRRLGHRSGAMAWESEWCFHCEQYVLAKIHIGEDVCQQCGNWL